MPPEVVLFISCFALVAGWLLWVRGNRLLTNGRRTQATVVDNQYRPPRRGGTGTYAPVVEIVTEDKTIIRQRLNYSFSWKTRLGKVMTVVYDPKNPSDIDSNPGFNLIVLPRVVTAVGVTGLIAAALEYLEVIHVFGWSS